MAHGHTSQTGTLTRTAPDVEGNDPVRWNDHVEFDAETTAPYPFLRVIGTQNGNKVLESWANVGTLHNPTFVMSSPAWLSGAAHVVATLVYYGGDSGKGPKWLELASTEFDVVA